MAGYAPVLGAREVLVPESGAQAAREVLAFEQPRTPPGEAGSS